MMGVRITVCQGDAKFYYLQALEGMKTGWRRTAHPQGIKYRIQATTKNTRYLTETALKYSSIYSVMFSFLRILCMTPI